MRLNSPLTLGLLALVLLILSGSLYTVYEAERSLVLRLGKLKRDENNLPVVYQPGLHVKVPFIDTVKKFDKRLQTLEVQSSRILTAEKKDVIVDSFIKWRIKNFSTFFTRTGGSKSRAENLLRQKIVDGLRAEFGQRTVKEVVSGERLQIMQEIREGTLEGASDLGIEVIDVRIKRIDLPAEVSDAVYNRMRTERERIAAEHRARGREKAEALRAQADKNVTVILAEASSKSLELRGEGDAEAAGIYAKSYSQDEEFYAFYRSLEAYKQAFNGNNDMLVINPNSEFFKYLHAGSGKMALNAAGQP